MRSIFRLVALLEGVSYILLLFVAVPIKYWGGDEHWVKLLGMPHGILFVIYIYITIAFFITDYIRSFWIRFIYCCIISIITFLLLLSNSILTLFSAFCILTMLTPVLISLFIKEGYFWELKVKAVVLLASILPFGTFYVDWKYLKK